MANARLDGADFPLAFCSQCRREVLTYVEFGTNEEESRHCVHCNHLTGDRVRAGTAAEAEAAGYALIDVPRCDSGLGCGSGCGEPVARGSKH